MQSWARRRDSKRWKKAKLKLSANFLECFQLKFAQTIIISLVTKVQCCHSGSTAHVASLLADWRLSLQPWILPFTTSPHDKVSSLILFKRIQNSINTCVYTLTTRRSTHLFSNCINVVHVAPNCRGHTNEVSMYKMSHTLFRKKGVLPVTNLHNVKPQHCCRYTTMCRWQYRVCQASRTLRVNALREEVVGKKQWKRCRFDQNPTCRGGNAVACV